MLCNVMFEHFEKCEGWTECKLLKYRKISGFKEMQLLVKRSMAVL